MFDFNQVTRRIGRACAALLATLVLVAPLTPVRANPSLTPGVWTNITPPGADIGAAFNNAYFLQGVTVDPSNVSTLYLNVVSYNPVAGLTAVWKSTDGGSTWNVPSSQLDEPLHVRVDPTNSNHLYAVDGVRGASMGFWVSTNGGTTWTQPAGFTTLCNTTLSGQGFNDSYFVDADPSNFNHLLISSHACGNGGPPVAAESTDGGNTWVAHYVNGATTCTGGYAVFFLYSPNLHVGNSQTWLFCTQESGMFRTTDSGNTWTKVCVTGMNHGSNQIYYTSSGVLFAGAAPADQNTPAGPGGVIKSTDNGVTWVGASNLTAWTGCEAIVGDGTNLYTGAWWQAGPCLTSLESDGLTWSSYNSQQFVEGPFEEAYDKVNGIVYSAITPNGNTCPPGDGLWALKVLNPGAPAAPTGLTANPGNAQVSLAWSASSGATSYNVLRSTVNGSGYSSVVTGLSTTSYTNTGLTNGSTYYFVVTATNANGASGNSNQASATPTSGPPPAPTALTATPGNTQVALSWGASAGATSYNVLRSTVNGSGYVSVTTGLTALSYTNTGLTNGTAYYFVVTAVDAGGTSANSNQAFAVPTNGGSAVIQINAAGPAVSPFVADVDFSGGTPATNWTGAIDTSAVTNPAPQAVYQSERYGPSTYTIGGLTNGTNYTVRLHLCENYLSGSGQREFNVSINGTQVLTNFDIFATAGAAHKANIQQFTATANGSGQVVLVFTNGALNAALVDGIEVWTIGAGGPPPAPTGLGATPGNAQVALTWTASSGATSYNVLRSTVSGSGYASVATGVSTTNYTNTGLTNGTTYYFVVAAVNSGGTSANSNQASATPSAGPPAAPTGLTATAGNAQVGLTWTASTGATSYNVLRSTVSGSGYANVVTGVAATAYTNTGLTNGATYYFVVTAVNAAGASGNSNQASATPNVSAPPAPTGLAATPGNAQVALTWTASSGATSYNVLRSTVSGSGYASVTTGLGATAYTNTGLTNGTTYYFVVTAVNSGGTSANSNQASATPSAGGDPAQFNFESGLQGWTSAGAPITGIATSTTQHFAGAQSMAITINGAAGNTGVTVSNVSVPAGTTITAHFWVPSGNQIGSVILWEQDANFTYTGTYVGGSSLTTNAWNTITVTIPSNGTTPLQNLGLSIDTSATWSGTCYLDSVGW